eukprot:s42_g22.t1
MMRMMRREQDDKEDDGEVDGAANKSMNSHLHLTKRGSIMQSRRFFVDKSLQFVSAVTAKEPIGSGCTQRFGRHCRLRMAVLYPRSSDCLHSVSGFVHCCFVNGQRSGRGGVLLQVEILMRSMFTASSKLFPAW